MMGALYLFISEKVRVDVTAVLVILALVITRILDPKEALSGFSSEPAIIVAAVFVLSGALATTGVTDWIGEKVSLAAGKSEWRAILVFMFVVASLSAFTHHLMITAMMLPVVMKFCEEKKIASSRVLIPMATAASLGTTMTIISAPAFLLAASILKRSGEPALGVFSVFPLGITLTLMSIVFIILIRWILPKRSGESGLENKFQIEQFYTELVIPQNSKWIGVEYKEFSASTEKRFDVVDWVREGATRSPISSSHTIKEGDLFLVKASPEEIVSIDEKLGLALNPVKKYAQQIQTEEGSKEQPALLQAIISPTSRHIGKTIANINFLRLYELIVVGVWRKNGWLKEKLSETKVRPNDLLVFWGKNNGFDRLIASQDFLFLNPLSVAGKKRAKIWVAAIIMITAIVSAAYDWLPPHISFLAGAIMMVLTGCVSLEKAYESIEVKIFVMIAGVIPLGIAMEKTGVANLIASNLSQIIGSWSPFYVMLMLFTCAALLTQILSDAATTVLLAPVAILLANKLQISPTAAVITTTVGAVASFLTPIGHHGNLLILSPGDYRFVDFLKVGLPLTILIAVVTSYLSLQLFS
ncbi:MAG: SLC13 family permease [Bdellovibrionota bacterium]